MTLRCIGEKAHSLGVIQIYLSLFTGVVFFCSHIRIPRRSHFLITNNIIIAIRISFDTFSTIVLLLYHPYAAVDLDVPAAAAAAGAAAAAAASIKLNLAAQRVATRRPLSLLQRLHRAATASHVTLCPEFHAPAMNK